MAEAEPDPNPQTVKSRSCLAWVLGFVLAGLASAALAAVANQNNAPGWVVVAVGVAPQVMFFALAALVGLPRVIRQYREAVRNAPSPESAAAVARGGGVEAGTSPKPPDDAPPDDFPAVTVLDTCPGRVLTHRLTRTGVPPGCQFGCTLGVALFWNGIVGVFVYQIYDQWNRGQRVEWFTLVFLTPFVLVGLAIIGAALYSLLKLIVAVLVGTVEVELSGHPLTPGAVVRVHVAQTGSVPLAQVALALVCTEQATYVAGTSKSTAKKQIAAHVVFDPDRNADGGGLPLATGFAVPGDAMHSFHAPNNEINWTVRVTGRVLGGLLPFSDDYGVTIVPGTP